MERLLQYMDDIDDLYGAAGLVYERLRRLVFAVLTLIVGAVNVALGIWLALFSPPIALATTIILFVTLLYRAVTTPSRPWAQPV